MTDPVRCSVPRPTETVDAVIHEAVSARSEVRLDSTRPTVREEDAATELASLLSEHAATHAGGEAAMHLVDLRNVSSLVSKGFSLSEAQALAGSAEVLGITAAPASMLAVLMHGAASDFRRGREENMQYHYDMMRGVLAVFETRSAEPGVVRERNSNPAFRDGCDRAERIIAQDAEMTDRIMNAVRTTETEGYASVVLGRDHGRVFERRYREDLCFRHAVDHARRHEQEGDARWTEIRERVESACEHARYAVASAPIRI